MNDYRDSLDNVVNGEVTWVVKYNLESKGSTQNDISLLPHAPLERE